MNLDPDAFCRNGREAGGLQGIRRPRFHREHDLSLEEVLRCTPSFRAERGTLQLVTCFRTIVRSLGASRTGVFCTARDGARGKPADRKVVPDFHFGGTRKAGIVRGNSTPAK